MFAVVEYTIKYQGSEIIKKKLQSTEYGIKQQLRIHAKVKAFDGSKEKTKVPLDAVCLDQTIRNAIGIPYHLDGQRVRIYPIRMNFWRYFRYVVRYRLARIFGMRFLYFRVNSSHIHDMEKNIVRIPKDSFEIMGTDPESKIILESPVEHPDRPGEFQILTRSIAAHVLTDEILKLRKRLEEEPEIRYRNPPKWFTVIPDIDRIFIDQAGRQLLDIKQLYPIKARRSTVDTFMNIILAIGLFFFISLLSIVSVLPIESTTWKSFAISVSSGLVITIFLVVLILRSKVK
jgi:hypothetical protein